MPGVRIRNGDELGGAGVCVLVPEDGVGAREQIQCPALFKLDAMNSRSADGSETPDNPEAGLADGGVESLEGARQHVIERGASKRVEALGGRHLGREDKVIADAAGQPTGVLDHQADAFTKRVPAGGRLQRR